jgi:hydroxymethylpyrimidine/phosphomethylpyrimidine kinase
MPLVISIAGSDPGRGAGLQMDERVCRRMGVQFRGVVAVDTVQDDGGLRSVTPRPVEQVVEELQAALVVRQELDGASDHAAAGVAVKTGALGTSSLVMAVAEVISNFNRQIESEVSLIIDPVRLATKHLDAQLLSEEGWSSLKERLFPLATLVTPNTLEFGEGSEYENCRMILLKGGHRHEGDPGRSSVAAESVCDELWHQGELIRSVVQPRLKGGTDVHGTGCALSALISVHLAQSKTVTQAVEASLAQLHQWIQIALANRSDLLQ